VADNSTLNGGESTWGWRNEERLFYASPVAATFTQAGASSGLQWVATKGVRQLYWNQTLYDLVASGKESQLDAAYLACYSTSGSFSDNL
jgi:hypothetical protein